MITAPITVQPRPQHAISRWEILRALSKKSFERFVRIFWDTIIAEELVWNWHLTLLCEELQEVAERVFLNEPKQYDLIVNVPPGTTKSTLASVMFPAWVWCRMPSARSICASYAHALALDLSRKCRDVILSERYQTCFPEIQLREDQNTKGYYANTLGGMRYSVGTGGSVTGFHAHFLIVDDPLDPRQSVSEAELKSTNSWMAETLPTRKTDKLVTPTILIMQRLHQNDPTGNMLEKRGDEIKHISLPADSTEAEVKPPELEGNYQDNLLDPVRLSRSVLDEAYKTLLEYAYAGQYLQTPVPPGGGMFKVERLTIDTEPNALHWKRVVRFWDKAGTHGGGAYTVGALLGMDLEDTVWVIDIVRGQWDSDARESMILLTTQLDHNKYGRKLYLVGIEQEPGSGGMESARNTVKKLRGHRVIIDKPTGDKVLRADPFSTQVNARNVKLVQGQWNHAYIEELRYFPYSTYKDQIDGSSGSYNILARTSRRAGALF